MIEIGVSYSATGWPHHFERDLADIRAHHCSYIVHCFRENELIFAHKRTAAFFRKCTEKGLYFHTDFTISAQHDEELLATSAAIMREAARETIQEAA